MITQDLSAGFSNTLLNSQNVASDTNKKLPLGPSMRVAIDWLQWMAVIPADQLQPLLETAFHGLGDMYTLEIGVPRSHGKPFANSGRSVRGGAIAWNVLEDGFLDVWVSQPAKVLSGSTVQEVWEVMGVLKCSFGCKFTRLDICIDDFEKSLDPRVIIQAYDAGNYSKFSLLQEYTSRSRGEKQGFTIYFGAATSEKRVRFYDKSAESKGEIDAYRLEVQLRRESANLAVLALLDIDDFEELAPVLLGSFVAGAIDFVDRGSDGHREKNLDRCERLPWWQEFLDKVGGALRLAPKKVKPTLQRSIEWVDRQVQVSLSMIADVLGPGFRPWLRQQLKSGKSRYNDYHKKIIELSKRDYASQDFAFSGI